MCWKYVLSVSLSIAFSKTEWISFIKIAEFFCFAPQTQMVQSQKRRSMLDRLLHFKPFQIYMEFAN